MKVRIALIFVGVVGVPLVLWLMLVGHVKPQHTISRRDIVTAAVSDIKMTMDTFPKSTFNRSRLPDTNITTEIWVRLNKRATTGFEKYSRERPDQDIHILHGANNIADIALYYEFTNEQTGEMDIDLFFTNYDDAAKALVGLVRN
jgi:hypothetical protein